MEGDQNISTDYECYFTSKQIGCNELRLIVSLVNLG